MHFVLLDFFVAAAHEHLFVNNKTATACFMLAEPIEIWLRQTLGAEGFSVIVRYVELNPCVLPQATTGNRVASLQCAAWTARYPLLCIAAWKASLTARYLLLCTLGMHAGMLKLPQLVRQPGPRIGLHKAPARPCVTPASAMSTPERADSHVECIVERATANFKLAAERSATESRLAIDRAVTEMKQANEKAVTEMHQATERAMSEMDQIANRAVAANEKAILYHQLADERSFMWIRIALIALIVLILAGAPSDSVFGKFAGHVWSSMTKTV
jgi:hypothetical protein